MLKTLQWLLTCMFKKSHSCEFLNPSESGLSVIISQHSATHCLCTSRTELFSVLHLGLLPSAPSSTLLPVCSAASSQSLPDWLPHTRQVFAETSLPSPPTLDGVLPSSVYFPFSKSTLGTCVQCSYPQLGPTLPEGRPCVCLVRECMAFVLADLSSVFH